MLASTPVLSRFQLFVDAYLGVFGVLSYKKRQFRLGLDDNSIAIAPHAYQAIEKGGRYKSLVENKK